MGTKKWEFQVTITGTVWTHDKEQAKRIITSQLHIPGDTLEIEYISTSNHPKPPDDNHHN